MRTYRLKSPTVQAIQYRVGDDHTCRIITELLGYDIEDAVCPSESCDQRAFYLYIDEFESPLMVGDWLLRREDGQFDVMFNGTFQQLFATDDSRQDE